MPVTLTRKTRNGLAIAAVVALALSACSPSSGSDVPSSSGSGSPAAQSTSGAASESSTAPASKSASPTPVPASSKGPAKNLPVPTLPPQAEDHTLQGAAKFGSFYFELIEYTSTSNDTKTIKRYSSASCQICQDDVIGPADRNKKKKAWNAGGAYHPVMTAAKFSDKKGALVSFKYNQDKRYVYNSPGEVETIYAKTKSPVYGTFSLKWEHGWKVQSINIVDS